MFEPRFHALYGVPPFFGRIITIHFAKMVAKKQAITYDNVILQAITKKYMWRSLESFFLCLRSSGVKGAPNKTIFLRKVIFLRQRNSVSCRKGPRSKKT